MLSWEIKQFINGGSMIAQESNCNRCTKHKNQLTAKTYCTHYKLSTDDSCCRDFDKFPLGRKPQPRHWDGIKGTNEQNLYMYCMDISDLLDMEELVMPLGWNKPKQPEVVEEEEQI